MEFNEVLRMRQSVRRYTEEKVSAEDIQAILTAAQHAPVGMHNSKGYVLTVISSEAAGLPESTVPLCGLAVGHSAVPLRPRPDEAVFNVTYAE